MTRYLIRRFLWAIVLFLVVTFVTYLIFFIVPADPARQFAGKGARPEDIARVKHYLGLDQSVVHQYGRFLGRLVGVRWRNNDPQHPAAFWHISFETPSLGQSFATRQSENSIIFHAAPKTASLVIGGAILWLLISIPIGILSALRPRSLLDRFSTIVVFSGISLHPVFIGLVFLYVFAFKLGWFPIGNYCEAVNPVLYQCQGGPFGWQWFDHLVLPWITFAILFTAFYVRFIRSAVLETVNEDYVRTARAKGAPERTVLRRHILRNAMLPIVTILGMDVATALGGAIFTETVYSIPGLGLVVRQSLDNFDLPTIQAVIVFATIVIIVMSLVVDLLYAVIDPRIRFT